MEFAAAMLHCQTDRSFINPHTLLHHWLIQPAAGMFTMAPSCTVGYRAGLLPDVLNLQAAWPPEMPKASVEDFAFTPLHLTLLAKKPNPYSAILGIGPLVPIFSQPVPGM